MFVMRIIQDKMQIKLASSLFIALLVINGATAEAESRIDFSLSARNLPNSDPFGGAPDPYVEVWYAPSYSNKFSKVGKTSYKSDNKNPTWDNKVFTFYVFRSGAATPQRLKFEIYDSDSLYDEHIGTVQVPLNALVTENNLDKNIPGGKGILNISSKISQRR